MKTFKSLALAAAMLLGVNLGANAQILYKVEKAGSDKVSYLLGTHHFAPLAVVDSIAELPEILKSVDKLYGEIDMAVMQDPATMMKMQQQLVAPADSTLDKVMNVEQIFKLGSVLSDYAGQPVPMQMLYGMKPAVISTQLAALMTQKVFPALATEGGIDMVMQTRAHELGIPVAGLEDMDFQIDMMYGRPIAEQAKDLAKVIEDPKEEERMAVKLSKSYLNHDIKGILDLMLESEAEDPGTAERIIFSRNDNWVKQLSEEMPQASLMVVVGAGHLPGDRGVIAGLEKAGFTVTPVDR